MKYYIQITDKISGQILNEEGKKVAHVSKGGGPGWHIFNKGGTEYLAFSDTKRNILREWQRYKKERKAKGVLH